MQFKNKHTGARVILQWVEHFSCTWPTRIPSLASAVVPWAFHEEFLSRASRNLSVTRYDQKQITIKKHTTVKEWIACKLWKFLVLHKQTPIWSLQLHFNIELLSCNFKRLMKFYWYIYLYPMEYVVQNMPMCYLFFTWY